MLLLRLVTFVFCIKGCVGGLFLPWTSVCPLNMVCMQRPYPGPFLHLNKNHANTVKGETQDLPPIV